MNVECQSCHTLYNIYPSKIPPKGAGLKCRKCSSIVEVKPPAVAPEAGSVSENKVAEPDSRDSKKRVLVADDSAFFRMMLTELLIEAGYEVITARTFLVSQALT
ncbi:MAG: zinc-ribbon domain-containing protein [bacterium]|nr:zinc-ribbon domain-containing protein [bacterium]